MSLHCGSDCNSTIMSSVHGRCHTRLQVCIPSISISPFGTMSSAIYAAFGIRTYFTKQYLHTVELEPCWNQLVWLYRRRRMRLGTIRRK